MAQFDRSAIAGGEKRVFTMTAAVPHWSDGMDHMPSFEPIASSDFGIAGRAAIQRAAFDKQLRPGRPMDRAIDAAPAEQGRIRGVDDGVNA